MEENLIVPPLLQLISAPEGHRGDENDESADYFRQSRNFSTFRKLYFTCTKIGIFPSSHAASAGRLLHYPLSQATGDAL